MSDAAASKGVSRFIMVYALAWAGGTIAYVPLLTTLLPVRIARLAGQDAGVSWLAYIALAGAIAASVGGVLFGYLSDITRNRRAWIAGGLLLSCALLVALDRATTLTELIAGIMAWQLALNMMLGPLSAYAGDVVPDDRKGLLGGVMAFAPGVGALAGALVTVPGLAGNSERLILLAGLVILFVTPALLLTRPPLLDLPSTATDTPPLPSRPRAPGRHATRMWLARLSVQVAEATLFAYLYFWLIALDPTVTDNQTARLVSVTLLLSAPFALFAGQWSDRRARPILPLQICALLAAGGLIVMAVAPTLGAAIAGYGLFGVSGAIFLSLHAAQTLRILPRPERRGRDLGIFNLANTGPSLIMPWLAILLVPVFGYQGLFALLAVLAATSSLLLIGVARND